MRARLVRRFVGGPGPRIRLASDPGARGEVHELGNGLGLHAFHDARPVELDGLLDHAEVGGNLLVEPACRQRFENLALA